jgi:hypothetical protein
VTGSVGLRRFVPGAAPAPAPAAPAAAPDAPEEPGGPGQPDATAPGSGSGRPAGRPSGSTPGRGTPGQPPGGAPAQEKCELCATEVAAEHGHVADLEQSTLICACRACYLLFTHAQAGRGRYRAVPDRYRHDPARQLSVAEWDEFEIPVGLAFFLRSSQRGEVSAFYPSPAGATESTLNLQAWDRLTAAHPLLGAADADTEAILICRTDSGVEYFLVPIDACYELAGRMRLHWRGFDGGTEARQSIAEFLGQVRSRSRAWPGES